MRSGSKCKPRTYRIVGPQQQIDERNGPHFRARRGEMGERIREMLANRSKADPLRRIFGNSNELKGGPNNSYTHVLNQAPEGGISPERIPVTDPAAMARNIKEIARSFGVDAVGICKLDQAYVYSHRARVCAAAGEEPGEPIQLTHKWAICLGVAGDYDKFLTNNSQIASVAYGISHNRTLMPTLMLAAYIREMGYPARSHAPHLRWEVNPIALAVNAGLGELGRHGLLINEEFGARLGLSVVTTDLPLSEDAPLDIGVEDFCKICMKCARNCPSYSISFGDKVVVNGVEKWAINVDTCYKHRLAAKGRWTNCTICITACCYNKRTAWWHSLAVWLVKKTPIPMRPLYIRPLLWIDDLFWGKRPWRHMKWLDYDNAPVPVACKIPGCDVPHRSPHHKRLHDTPKRS